MRQLIFLIFLSGVIGVNAQTYDFGDIPKEQLEMEVYDKDSTASGVVLFDKGETLIDYYNDDFHVSFKRHVRIKILTDDGFDLADIGLGFRTSEPEQRVKNIKATSYTLMENGKVRKESVGRRDRFKEKITDSHSSIKFTIPGVQKGSVIEYSYELVSENPFDFPDWFFQREIPVLWSEYLAQIPEWFNYLTIKKGYHDFYANERENYSDRVVFGTGANTTRLDYKGIEYYMSMKDIPALTDEPYMKVTTDYLAHVRFQLSSYKLPGTFMKNVLGSWQELVNSLLEDEDFVGRLVSSSNIISATFEAIQGSESDLDKMINIYNYLSELMVWNNRYGKYSFEKLEDIFEEGTANGASINLILIQMMREVGLEAHPVILSTRIHGEIIDMFPTASQFNHTIAYVRIDDQYFLLDAKNESRPYNLLPSSVTNGNGLLIKEGGVQWIPLENNVKHSIMKMVALEIDSTGYKGVMDSKARGFLGYNVKNLIDTAKVNTSIKNYEFDVDGNFSVDSVTIMSSDLKNSFDYRVEFSNQEMVSSDIIYFNPMITEYIESNPFKIRERTFPVDYDFTFDKAVIMNITVPEGWTVDEIPESVLHRLPEGAGEFRRIIKSSGGKIMMNYRFRINKERFSPEEYHLLKEMYDVMTKSVSETIVIKKYG